MDKELYSVLDSSGNHLGYHMELRHALLFIEALMHEYYLEPYLTYRIMREQSGCEERSSE